MCSLRESIVPGFESNQEDCRNIAGQGEPQSGRPSTIAHVQRSGRNEVSLNDHDFTDS